MKLVSLLNDQMIFCGLPTTDRPELYGRMLKQAASAMEDVHLDIPDVVKQLMEREDSLGIAYEGMALPHVRLAGLDDLYIIIATLQEPRRFKSNDVCPSSLVVMSLISDTTSQTYLKMLSAFTRYVAKPENLAKLEKASSAEEFMDILREDGVSIKRNITAEDMMTRDCPRVKVEDNLSTALDLFNRDGSEVLPVVDDAGKLLGILDATEVIKSFIPDYIFMMDNLKFLTSFEVFEKIFKEENHLQVKNYLKPAHAVLAPDTPLIQFTVGLAKREAWTYYVIDEQNTLLGEISIHNIIHKVLRG